MNKRFLLLMGLCLLLLAFTGCDMVDNPEADGPTPTLVPTMPPEEEPTDEPEATEAPEDSASEDGDAWTSSEEGLADDTLPTLDDAAPEDDDVPLDQIGTIIPEDDGTGAEDPDAGGDDTPAVEWTPAPVSVVITPEPGETPILLDPIDKPTEAPVVSVYRPYTNTSLNISYDVPLLWGFYSTAETNMAFYEPDESAIDGYPASLTVQAYSFGSDQNAEDAKNRLVEIMDELAVQGWDSFSYNNDSASTSMAKAKGYYAYYTATFKGTKVRGRVMVVAHGTWLYQVRISCPASRYSSYENVYRQVRSSWTFL